MTIPRIAALCLAVLFGEAARAATYYIDPTAAVAGDGSISAPFTNWSQMLIAPGNSYLQRAGTTVIGTIAVQVPATSQTPIYIGRYGTGNPPILVGQALFNFAAYATIENFDVRDSPGPGVQILTNCEHVEVRGLRIYHCSTGVTIAADAKADNLVADSFIYENDGSGVAILGGQTSVSHMTTIRGNTIYRNGLHGVQVRGNFYVIDGNEIHTNGLSGIPGTSGVHIYSPSSADNSGDFNIVRNNRISHQQDFDGFDGNGIQSDHFCDNNEINNNILFQNDGGGIFIYDAQNCSVHDNILYGNMRDRGSMRQALGELDLATKSSTLDRVIDNTISNNVIVAVNPNAVPVFVDSLTAEKVNAFGGNGFYHEGGGNLWWAAPVRGIDMAVWNAFAAGNGDDYAYDPVSAGFVLPAPPPAYMLDATFTLHSGLFQTIHPNVTNVFVGGPANEIIVGENLADTLVGNGGNDTINGLSGDDWVVGGAGNDTLSGGDGIDLVLGGFGDDSLDGAAGDDGLFGGDGADTMLGGTDDDKIFGGNGNDQLFGGDGQDTLEGGTGDDLLAGGPGNDRIDESGDTSCSVNSIFGDDGDDIITGGCGNDSIAGGNGADIIDAGAGDDRIDSSGDVTAQNTANGGAGSDTLSAGELGDTLRGDAGDDILVGGSGPDILYEHDDPAGRNLLSGAGGNDRIYGGGGPDEINGGAGADLIDAGPGDDRIVGGSDNDTVLADDGNDFLSGDGGSDQLHAGQGNDIVLGGAGDDTISGGAGNDILDGGTNNDVIDGGDGADILIDGPGDDRMTGGSGADTSYFGSGSGHDVISDLSPFDFLMVARGCNGTSIDTVADLWSRLTNTAGGVVLDLGAGNQVLLEGLTVASIEATQNMFVGDSLELPETTRILSLPESMHSLENAILVVPVSIDAADGITSMSFSLHFEPGVVTYLDYEKGELLAGWGDPQVQDIGGAISFLASGAAPLEGAGEVVRFRFQVQPNPTSVLSLLTFTQAELNNATIPVEPTHGVLALRDAPTLPLDETSVFGVTVVLATLGAITLFRKSVRPENSYLLRDNDLQVRE